MCYGADCFRAAFVTGAVLELCAMLLALVLHFRTRALYVRRAERVQSQQAERAESAREEEGCERMDQELYC